MVIRSFILFLLLVLIPFHMADGRGGRGGGGRGGGGFSRGGSGMGSIRNSGNYGSRQGYSRSHSYDSSRQSSLSDSRTERQEDRQDNRTEHQGDREEKQGERQETRSDRQEERLIKGRNGVKIPMATI